MKNTENRSKAEIRVLILSKDFSAQGGVVNYVSSLMENSMGNVVFDHLSIGRNSTSKIRNLFFPFIDSVRLARKVSANRYDCVHINPSLNAKAVLRDGLNIVTLRLFGVKRIVVFFHGWEDAFLGKLEKNVLGGLLFRKIFQEASVILVLASRFRDSLVELGFQQDKIRVTTTMFDGRLFDGLERRQKKQKTLLFLSRFIPEKGVYELLSAFGAMTNRYPELTLILAGDGPERERMEQWVRERGMANRITFPGYLRGKEKTQVLLNSDIFVFPTYHGEGCPVSLLEAMAAGLPIITSTAGGIPDVFTDRENGILLTKITAQEIEKAISDLLVDEQRLSQVGENNRKRAWENYEANTVVSEMVKVYYSLNSSAYYAQ